MIADSHSRPFDLGDMLDANSTYNLINEVLYGENKTGIGVYDTNQQFQEDLAQGKIDEGAVYLICDIKSLYAEGQYIPLSTQYTGPYSVIITETEYAELERYEDNTIYFVIPDSSQSWTFGGTFPITLN